MTTPPLLKMTTIPNIISDVLSSPHFINDKEVLENRVYNKLVYLKDSVFLPKLSNLIGYCQSYLKLLDDAETVLTPNSCFDTDNTLSAHSSYYNFVIFDTLFNPLTDLSLIHISEPTRPY